MKFRKEIPQFDKFTQEFFYQQLQAKTKSQMEIDLEKKLSKFDKFKKQQEDDIKTVKVNVIRPDLRLQSHFSQRGMDSDTVLL